MNRLLFVVVFFLSFDAEITAEVVGFAPSDVSVSKNYLFAPRTRTRALRINPSFGVDLKIGNRRVRTLRNVLHMRNLVSVTTNSGEFVDTGPDTFDESAIHRQLELRNQIVRDINKILKTAMQTNGMVYIDFDAIHTAQVTQRFEDLLSVFSAGTETQKPAVADRKETLRSAKTLLK